MDSAVALGRALGSDTLRRRIVILTLSVLLPSLLAAGLLLWNLELQARRSLQNQLQNTARALSLVVDRQLGEQAAILDALSASPALLDGDFAAFDRVARRSILGHERWIVLSDEASNSQLVNSHIPVGAPLPTEPLQPVSVAGERGPGVTIGNMMWGPVSKGYVIGVSRVVRLHDGRRVRVRVLTMARDFQRVFADQDLPPRWTGSLIDARFHLIARNRDIDRLIGRPASAAVQAGVKRSTSGVVRAQTSDGIKTLAAFHRLPGYDWTVVVGVPRREVSLVAGGGLLWAGLTALALLSGGMLLAVHAARAIEDPVRTLAAAVEGWDRGAGFTPPRGHAPSEIRHLTAAFAAASDKLLAHEVALQDSNAQLSDTVRAQTRELDQVWRLSRDPLLIADAKGVWLRASPAWTEILGWSESELVGRLPCWMAHPDDQTDLAEQMAKVAGREAAQRFETRFRTRAGDYRWFSWTVTPFEGLNYCVARDVTVEKLAAQELERAQDALRQSQKMDAIGQLTGGVAHDFNNLLTPILGGIEAVRRRATLSERDARMLDAAGESAERARVLVQRLLAFARRQPLQPQAVDIAGLLTGVTTLIASTLGPRVRVTHHVARRLPQALADVNQLEMALLNLAVNARDAMPDGGTLTISAVAAKVSAGQIEGLGEGGYVQISVVDTGGGMDEATLARAVEPFFSTKGVGKGTGLGLSMAHGLAAQLGGALKISSTLGVGTRIDLWLPVARGGRAAKPKVADEIVPEGGAGLVLLVDDEELVRLTIAEMLETLGYSVVEVGGAVEALGELAGGLDPVLVITDHLMPQMTGADLAQALRVERPDLPVLVVSGYAEVDILPPDLPRLRKPFLPAELAAELKTLAIAAKARP